MKGSLNIYTALGAPRLSSECSNVRSQQCTDTCLIAVPILPIFSFFFSIISNNYHLRSLLAASLALDPFTCLSRPLLPRPSPWPSRRLQRLVLPLNAALREHVDLLIASIFSRERCRSKYPLLAILPRLDRRQRSHCGRQQDLCFHLHR